MNIKFLLAVLLLCIVSCRSYTLRSIKYWEREKVKVSDCRSNWLYQELDKERSAKVLYYSSAFRACVAVYPNFLILLTEEKDTIAFLDKEFVGKIAVGARIKLLPSNWSSIEKSNLRPSFIVFTKARKNDIWCNIKTVYFGKVALE